MNKIIITGATGHIGNNLIRYLLAEYNVPIKLLVRRIKDSAIDEFDVEKVVGDLSDVSFLNKEIEENSVVIHSAGLIDVTNKQINEMNEINNVLTRNLVDVCIKKRIAKFIYISSVDAIYKENNNDLITEPKEFYPEKLESNYGKSKAFASEYVLDKINKKELVGTIIYPSAVIGPYDFKVSSIGQVLVDNIHNRIMARLNGKYNFIDVRDLAESISYCVFNDVDSSYLVTGEVVSVDELFVLINKKLGKKKLPIKLPFGLIMFLANFIPLYYKLRKVKPVFTKFALKTLKTNCNYDNKKAINEIGLKVRPVEESINDAIDWFISNKY